MKLKELYNRAIFYLSVPKCVCCKDKLDYEDSGLCKACKITYDLHKQRNCPRCSHKLSECFCTYDELKNHGIKNLVKLFRYSKSDESMPSNYLIYSLKQDNRKDVIAFLADELSDAILRQIGNDPKEYVITSVPRRRRAVVDFGYDHAKTLAKAVSLRIGVEYVEVLRSEAKKPQKSVYGDARRENAKFDYKCAENFTLKGKTVIIVDDIITTGSSMINSATLIRGLKPKRIIGACIGTAYKEKGIEFQHSAY